jgi:hypothetical protein
LRYAIEKDIMVDANIEMLAADERSHEKEPLQAFRGMGLDVGEWKPVSICDRGYPIERFH